MGDGRRDPALTSELANKASGLVPEVFYLTEGLVTNISDLVASKGRAAALRNLHFIDGKWTSNDTGWSKHRATTFKNSAAAADEFEELAVHVLDAGTEKFVMQVGNKAWSYDVLANPATEVEAALFTATSASVPCMRSYSGAFFIYVNGVDEPQKWPGTGVFALLQKDTGAGLGNWPPVISGVTYSKPKICEIFVSRLVTARFTGDEFRILISKFEDPENYDVSGSSPSRAGVIKVKNFLGPIRGLKALKLSNDSNEEVLVVACRKGVGVIIGTDADTFQFIVLTTEYGILTNRTWIQLDNDLFFLASDGIRKLSALVVNANLLQSSLTYPIQQVIRDINKSAVERAFAVRHANTLEVIFWFPTGTETRNRRALIMNYSASSPEGGIVPVFSEKLTPPETGVASTHRSPSCGISYESRVWCGGYNGYLQEHYKTAMYDTEIIQFLYRSPLFSTNNPAQAADLLMAQLLLDGGDQDFTVNIYAYEQTQDGNTRKRLAGSRIIKTSTAGTTIIGSWIIGESAFSAAGPQIVEATAPGNGRLWQLEIVGLTSTASINFVGFESILVAGGLRQ